MDRERVDGEEDADKETDGVGGEREFVVRSRVMMAFLRSLRLPRFPPIDPIAR
jgi:hypothetical protein